MINSRLKQTQIGLEIQFRAWIFNVEWKKYITSSLLRKQALFSLNKTKQNNPNQADILNWSINKLTFI